MNAYQRLISDLGELWDLHPHDFEQFVQKAVDTVKKHEPHKFARLLVQAAMKKRAFSPHMNYGTALEQLHAEFVGAAGESLFNYIKMLNSRLTHREPFDTIHGFDNWDYGSPGMRDGKWNIRVWEKSGGGSGWEAIHADPNLLIVVDFDKGVNVSLVMGNHQTIFSQSWEASQVSASSIGMACGAAWEKLLTGSVDYGD